MNAKELPNCRDCQAQPGQLHEEGCFVEDCPYCGGQLASCDHCFEYPPDDDRMPWTGEWPGVTEAREFGWYAKLVPGRGWMPCEPNETGAQENLNRLRDEAVWDREQKRWIKRSTANDTN